MAYVFSIGTTQYIDYGTRTQFYQDQSLSFNFWLKIDAGASNDDRLVGVSAAFPPGICVLHSPSSTEGWGVICEHIKGGGSAFGVTCVPGLVKPAYKLNPGTWMFFGFSRDHSSMTYSSYFGSRTALVDGPTFHYLPAQAPFPITQPGQVNGPCFVGMSFGATIGPFSYWDTALTREQHLAMARCQLPIGVSITHLLLRSKMLEGAADLSPNMWPNTFHGSPLPAYEADDGCASFGSSDYRLYNG